jgi:hypothetical protein
MRFVTIMGLSLIASAINNDIVVENSKVFAIIALGSLIADIIDCNKNWRK